MGSILDIEDRVERGIIPWTTENSCLTRIKDLHEYICRVVEYRMIPNKSGGSGAWVTEDSC